MFSVMNFLRTLIKQKYKFEVSIMYLLLLFISVIKINYKKIAFKTNTTSNKKNMEKSVKN